MDQNSVAQEFEVRFKSSGNRVLLVFLALLTTILYSGLVIAAWHSYGLVDKALAPMFLGILACIPAGEIWSEKKGRGTIGRVRAAWQGYVLLILPASLFVRPLLRK